MRATLLHLRLLMQEAKNVGEPTLFVETTGVAAVWRCGCTAAGRVFEDLTLLECDLHKQSRTAAAVRIVREDYTGPSRLKARGARALA